MHNSSPLRLRQSILGLCLAIGGLPGHTQNSVAPQQLPSGAKLVSGNASVNTSGNSLRVNQSTTRAAIEWNSFNVGSDAKVQFNQPSATSVTLNRVVGGDPSQILGRINAPGHVFISNSSGVIFGPKAQVDVGGLLVTTLGISNDDFMAGKTSFSGNNGNAKVINQGTLQAALGGFVTLLAPEVRNEGIIVAHQGTVALAAGNKATLVFSGTSLTTVEVDQGILNALVDNKHMVMADGGLVLMTARSANALLGSLVKNSGTLQTQTIANRHGRILLLGDMVSGTTQVDGKFDASAPSGGDGGFVETSAAKVQVGPTTSVNTQSNQGKTGQWLIDPTDFTVSNNSGDISSSTLQTNLATSNVTLQSAAGATQGTGDIHIQSEVTWSSNNTLTLIASNHVNIHANMIASGNTAGLVISPNTAHTFGGVTQPASGNGVFQLLFGKSIQLTGTAPTLRIAGQNYTIVNQANLQYTADNFVSSGFYALVHNVDAAAYPLSNFLGLAGGAPFTGRFHGLGNHISNLTINTPAGAGLTQNLGLFAVIGPTGVVSDLGLLNGLISSLGSPGSLGSLAGFNQGLIFQSYSGLNVDGGNGTRAIGGLTGINEGTIQYSFARGNVTSGASTWAMGGLSGISTGTIRDSFAMGNLIVGANAGGIGTARRGIGGLLGYAQGSATGVYANGSITASTNASGVGGLIGYAQGLTLHKSYATGQLIVAGTAQNVGGLIGENFNSSVSNSYATGAVQVSSAGTEVGNFVGLHRNNTISQSYSTGTVTLGTGTTQGFYGSNNSAGLFTNNFWNTTSSGITSNPTKTGITGLNGSQMQTLSTFLNAGWDGNDWVQISGQNNDYPVMGIGHGALYVKANTSNSVYGSSPSVGYVLYNTVSPDIQVIGYQLTGTPAWKITKGGATISGTMLTGLNTAGTYSLNYASGLAWAKGSIRIQAASPSDWVIQPKTLTATIATGTSVYGNALVPGTVTLSGLVNGDLISTSAVSINTTGRLSSSLQLRAGSHTGIQSVTNVLSGVAASNYVFAGATGNYVVTPKPLSGSITASQSVYGLALTPGTASTSGMLASDVVTFGPVVVNDVGLPKSSSGYLKVGLYPSIQSFSIGGADGGNYIFGGTVGDYRVTAKPLVGSITNSASIYGSPLVPGAASIISGVSGSDVVSPGAVTVNPIGNTSSGGQLKAGTYSNNTIQTATLSGADASNYSMSATSTYTVTPLALTGILGAGSSVYGANLVPGTLAFTNKIAGDIVIPGAVSINTSGNTSSSGKLNAGTYANIQSVSSISGADSANYTFNSVTGEYTVTKKPLSGTLTDSTSVYGSALMPGTASITSGAVGVDTVNISSVTVQTAGNESATGKLKYGSYTQSNLQTATLAGTDANNYSFTPSSTYTVTLNATAIAGLTAAEIQELTPLQLQSLSNVQINSLLANKSGQLSANQFGALTPSQVSGLANTHIKNLSTQQLAGLNDIQISNLGLSQLGQLSPAQIASLSASQLKGLSTSQLQNLTATQRLAFSNQQLQSLSKAQVDALVSNALDKPLNPDNQMISDTRSTLREKNVIRYVNPDASSLNPEKNRKTVVTVSNQLTSGDVKGVQHLNPSQVADLAADQISEISLHQLKSLSSNQLANLSVEQLKALSPAQLSTLSTSQLAAFSDSQLKGLTPTQWRSLTDPQIAALSPTQIKAISASTIGQLKESQLQALTTEQINVIGTEYFQAMSKSQLGCFSCAQIRSLSAQVLADLAPQVFKELTNKKLHCMNAQQMASLPAEKLQVWQRTPALDTQIDQVQSLNPSQLTALSEANLQKWTTQNVQALQPVQISNLSTVQVQAILKHLSPQQITALNARQIASLTPFDGKQLQPLQWQALTPNQFALLSPQILLGLNKSQWRDLRPEQIAALTPLQLKSMSGDSLAELLPTQIQALQKEQLATLSSSQIRALTPKQQQILTADQLSNLQTEQREAFGNPALIAKPKSLNDNVIDKVFQQVPAEQLTTSQLVLLSPEQLRLLTPLQFRGMNPKQLASLAPAQWSLLSNEQLNAINPENWRNLEPVALKQLTPEQWASLSPSIWQALSANAMESLPNAALARLHPEIFKSLNAAKLNALSKSQWDAVSPEQVQALSPSQMANLSPLQMQKWNALQLAALSPEQLNAWTEPQWKNLTADQTRQLQPAQLSSLGPKAIQAFTPEQIQRLSGTQIMALSPDQLGSFKSPQLQGLSETQIAALTTNQIAGWTSDQFQILNPLQITAITPVFFNRINPVILQNMSVAQIAAISPQAIAAMGMPQVQSLTIVWMANLNASQLSGFLPHQIQMFSPIQLRAMPSRALWSMSNSQLQSFTPEQVTQFSPAQISPLISLFTPQQLTGLSQKQFATATRPNNEPTRQPENRPLNEQRNFQSSINR